MRSKEWREEGTERRKVGIVTVTYPLRTPYLSFFYFHERFKKKNCVFLIHKKNPSNPKSKHVPYANLSFPHLDLPRFHRLRYHLQSIF